MGGALNFGNAEEMRRAESFGARKVVKKLISNFTKGDYERLIGRVGFGCG